MRVVLWSMAVVVGATLLACGGTIPDPPKPPVQLGGTLAFTKWSAGGSDIYTMAAQENATQSNVTNLPTARNSQPCWNPDGTRIAFVTRRDGNAEIYSMNRDGTTPTRLTTDAGPDTEPAWSPDGTHIAFVSTRDGNASIYTMLADGSQATRVTNNPATDSNPCWSPDNLRLAFISTLGAGGKQHLYTVAVDGTGQQRAGSFADDEVEPAWSATNKLACVRSTDAEGAQLYSLGPTGAGAVRLTAGNLTHQGWHPSWAAADSAHIAFVSDQGGQQAGICVMDSNGNNVTRLTHDSAVSGEVAWGKGTPTIPTK
jgi:Tol biopolymer transport system component